MRFCQRCGGELEEMRLCAPLWITFLRCRACQQDYLDVADARWVYPLQFLALGVLEKALGASEEQLKIAAAQIRIIDYKTVSIVEFEKFLMFDREQNPPWQGA